LRFAERLPERDREIFGRVVPVDFDVARRAHFEIERTVSRDLFEHVREKRERRSDVVFAAVRAFYKKRCGASGAVAIAKPKAASDDARDDEPKKKGCRYWPWAALMARTFRVDVTVCPSCGGRLKLVALVQEKESSTGDPRLKGVDEVAQGWCPGPRSRMCR